MTPNCANSHYFPTSTDDRAPSYTCAKEVMGVRLPA